MRLIYDIFFTVFSIFYLPVLLFRGRLHGDFLQRFGVLPQEVTSLDRPVWIHAVSVGEAALASKLARAIKAEYPHVPVAVSTTTRTGNDMARKSGKGAIDAVFYFPLDMSFIVSKAVRLINPRLYVMIETEIWPNLLAELHAVRVPVVLANGRISDASFTGYGRIRPLVRRILSDIDLFCMQSPLDVERIEKLGAPPEKISVTGSIKFDVTESAEGRTKEDLGFSSSDRVIVAGSTHHPEEHTVIDIYRELKTEDEDLKLVLAPRHVERTEALKVYLENAGLSYRLFSSAEGKSPGGEEKLSGRDVLIVDTIGHLKSIYKAATVVFIGGTMVKRGGQNPIEAALWGKAVIYGPNMSNFREIADLFEKGRATWRIKDAEDLKGAVSTLLKDGEKRRRMERNALRIVDENSGAVRKTLERVGEYLAQ